MGDNDSDIFDLDDNVGDHLERGDEVLPSQASQIEVTGSDARSDYDDIPDSQRTDSNSNSNSIPESPASIKQQPCG